MITYTYMINNILKTKFAWEVLKSFKKNKKKLKFWDIGCANGSLMFLKKHFPH